VRDDTADTLAELRDELDIAAQRMAAIRTPDSSSGSDRTGVVTVVVEPSGRVAAVTVAANWREHFTADAMASAVREAVEAASSAQLSAWEPAAELHPASEPSARPMPLPYESLGAQLSELTAPGSTDERQRVVIEELASILEAVERSLAAAVEQLETRESAVHAGYSRGRHVMVSVGGAGAFVDLRCDRCWLSDANEHHIGREITEAFNAAYQEAYNALDSAPRELAGLRQLVSDPRSLAQRLYLCDE